jgi:hypothetical protein
MMFNHEAFGSLLDVFDILLFSRYFHTDHDIRFIDAGEQNVCDRTDSRWLAVDTLPTLNIYTANLVSTNAVNYISNFVNPATVPNRYSAGSYSNFVWGSRLG